MLTLSLKQCIFYCTIAVVWSSQQILPSLIWDLNNPIINCRCNWLNIPEFQNSDRINVICPKFFQHMSYMERDVDKSAVYYNIFLRKLDRKNYDLSDLKLMLQNGSFCDPSHKDTEKLHTCERYKNKEGYAAYKIKIGLVPQDLKEGDIAVLFGNTKDGSQKELRSEVKVCSIVFVFKVSRSRKVKYDFSYGKCLNTEQANCSEVNDGCNCGCDAQSYSSKLNTTSESESKVQSKSSKLNTTSERESKVQSKSSKLNTTSERESKVQSNSSKLNLKRDFESKDYLNCSRDVVNEDNNENVTKASTRNRQSSASEDKFLYGFFVGFVTAIGVIGVVGVILLCLVKKVYPYKKKKSGDKTLEKEIGHVNRYFAPVSPTRVTPENIEDQILQKEEENKQETNKDNYAGVC